jgi:hypothetical protein
MKKMQASRSERYARVFGSPGERPRFDAVFRAAWPLLAVAAGTGYLVRALLPAPALNVPQVGLLFLLLAVGLALGARFSRSRLAAFTKGARGEERVARELSLLPAEHTVYHGLAGAGSSAIAADTDYDHIVVGPTGVFVIETKNWSGQVSVEDGRVLCDGREPSRGPLEQVKHAANALRARMKASCGYEGPLQPVVCFAGDSLPGGREGAAGVVLCNVARLHTLICSADPGGSVPPDAVAGANRFLQGLVD